jgi:hypothetical protein
MDLFKRNKDFDLREVRHIDVTEDPVRPELDLQFRISHGRKVYALYNAGSDEQLAIICVAYTNDIPRSVAELDELSKDAHLQSMHRANLVGKIAVAYTVWARKKGGGKHIVNEIYKKYRREQHIERLVTLSPLTDMAYQFHTKNGAKMIQMNKDTQNFEYNITLEKWEKYLERFKKRIAI